MRARLPALLLILAMSIGPRAAPASEIPEEWEAPRPELAERSRWYAEGASLFRRGDEAGALAVWRSIDDGRCTTDVTRAARRHVAAWEARRLRFGPAARVSDCPSWAGTYRGRVDELWLAATFARLAGDDDRAASLYGSLVGQAPTFPQAVPASEWRVRLSARFDAARRVLWRWDQWLEGGETPPPPALGIELATEVADALDRQGETRDADRVRDQARRLGATGGDTPRIRDLLVRMELGEVQRDLGRLERFRFPPWDPWGPCPEADGADPATRGLLGVPGASGPSAREDRRWPQRWDAAVEDLDTLAADIDARFARLAERATEPALRAELLLLQARGRELAGVPWTDWPAEPPACHDAGASPSERWPPPAAAGGS